MINKDEYLKKVQESIIFPGFAHQMKIVSCFENRSHIKYTKSFNELVLAKAEPIITGMPEVHLCEDEMADHTHDKLIVELLRIKKAQFLTREQLLVLLAHMMWDQRNGEEGILSVTEYNNSFYIDDFVVTVGYGISGFQCDAIPYMMRGKRDFIFYPTFIADSVATI